ncbi:MAG TPA: aspartate aminotransferase family protein [Myxococcales bacterium]|nr:aspartate aminotransferase family protein [Myxococcales bacterium]HIL00788.1 aspartate aminotransferase family protein [Myxococcales bacterium]
MASAYSIKKSNAHYKQAVKRLPMGVSSNYRSWGPDQTLYVSHGKGARLWDIDGNSYVDYRLGFGPAILGYADERVDEAAREGMSVGGPTALSTEREHAVAERIAGMVRSVDMVRFANSGTEAVMAGLRLARSFTGRSRHIMIEGGYHGLSDGVLWEMHHEQNEAGDVNLEVQSEGRGVPTVLRTLFDTVPLNDPEKLEEVLRVEGNDVAVLLIEVILGNAGGIVSEPGYLKRIRSLCDEYGVVLMVDEVKTGFRVARGGVQELMDVEADICTFAKAMGNGYPISAVAGREEIMSTIGPEGSAQGGTYAAHPVSLAAAEKTLQILDETDALEKINEYGVELQQGISQLLSARGVTHTWSGHPSMSGVFFMESAPRNYEDWVKSDYEFYEALAARLIGSGILVEPDSREPFFISAAHDDSCLNETLEKFESALSFVLDERAQKK